MLDGGVSKPFLRLSPMSLWWRYLGTEVHKSPVARSPWRLNFCAVASNICGVLSMELASCHSGALNFEMVNLYTPVSVHISPNSKVTDELERVWSESRPKNVYLQGLKGITESKIGHLRYPPGNKKRNVTYFYKCNVIQGTT
jgi:hypothetical protein